MRHLSFLIILLSGYMSVAQDSYKTFISFDGTQIAYLSVGYSRGAIVLAKLLSEEIKIDNSNPLLL